MEALDLIADLNAQDDDGLGWSTLADATAPERIHPGAIARSFVAVRLPSDFLSNRPSSWERG